MYQWDDRDDWIMLAAWAVAAICATMILAQLLWRLARP